MAITDEITNNFIFLYVKKNSIQPVGYVDVRVRKTQMQWAKMDDSKYFTSLMEPS